MTGTGRRGPGPSLARRLDLMTGVIIALFVVVAVLVGANLLALRNDMNADQRRAVPALLATDRLLTALVNQETGVRGYLLGHNSDLLEPYNTGLDQQASSELRLHDLLVHDTTGRRYLSQLDDAVSNWQVWASEALNMAEQLPGLPRDVQQQEATRSKALFDTI